MGYIYIQHNDTYEVGYYLVKHGHSGTPYNQFHSETVWATPEEAAARVNYLNGGIGNPPAIAVPRKSGE